MSAGGRFCSVLLLEERWQWMAIHCLVAVVLQLYCFRAATQLGNITGRELQSNSVQQAESSSRVYRLSDALVKAAFSQRAPRDKQTLKTAARNCERLHLHMLKPVKRTSSQVDSGTHSLTHTHVQTYRKLPLMTAAPLSWETAAATSALNKY